MISNVLISSHDQMLYHMIETRGNFILTMSNYLRHESNEYNYILFRHNNIIFLIDVFYFKEIMKLTIDIYLQ